MRLPEPHFPAPVAMVRPQETALVPTVSGQLERSSSKAEAIRRGDLKISGPIPLTGEEEQDLAKRNTDAIPQRTDSTSTRNLLHKESINARSHNADPVETTSELQESHPGLRHKRSSTGIRDLSEIQRHTSLDLLASHNSPSPFASASDNSAKMTPKKKRRSGLRNVFRKIFGKRSKEEVKRDSAQKHGYHHSDPGTLITPTHAKSKENVGTNSSSAAEQRISGLPVHEPKPINLVGQHLPFPMNVNAPEEGSPPHDYLTFKSPPKLHRRRATLPSVVLSGAEVATSAIWSGSGTRVMPWDEQGQTESIQFPEIGVALSSPTHSKRRSRSAGALRESSKRPDSLPRRRSAEIRYWRTSGMDRSASVYSTSTPRPQEDEDGTKDTKEEVSEPMVTKLAEPTTNDGPLDIPLPTQAFNFGALKSEFEASEDEIEEAIDSPPTLEERIQRVERGMQVLEQSLHRLTGRSHRQTIILENAPKGRRSRQHSNSTARDEYSRQSSKSSIHDLGIKEEPSGPPSPSLPLAFLTSPSSAGSANVHITPFPQIATSASPQLHDTTPQAAQSSTTLSTNPTEQFAAVYIILRHERAARKALDKQVLALQREVADLRSLALKLSASAYPTPSPDAVLGSSESARTPRAYRGPERGVGFESEEGGLRGRVRERITSRFSRSDSEGVDGDGEGDEGDDGTRVGEEVEEKADETGRSSSAEVASPELWATPREEVAGYGFFRRSGVVGGKEGDMI